MTRVVQPSPYEFDGSQVKRFIVEGEFGSFAVYSDDEYTYELSIDGECKQKWIICLKRGNEISRFNTNNVSHIGWETP